jgi:hypothetical protein
MSCYAGLRKRFYRLFFGRAFDVLLFAPNGIHPFASHPLDENGDQ